MSSLQLYLDMHSSSLISQKNSSAKVAYSYGWSIFVSHRSGETTDDFIADLTIGLGTGHLKSGSPCRGERVAKYNRLMDIEDEIRAADGRTVYAGEDFGQTHNL